VDRSYGLYCLADPVFYDSLTRAPGSDAGFAAAERPLPGGWRRSEQDDWLMCQPEGSQLPLQGWKVHASACLENAEEILGAVWDFCVPRRIPFKFVRSDELLLARNAKYAERGGSGKFVTIYPADDAQLELILTELGAVLEGQVGPYILSDLRWRSGPLYFRYGGFTNRYCLAENGELVPAIEDGDGQLVPDSREATFEVPSWVTLPDFLEPQLAARSSDTVEELPYGIEGALHFSNGGGVYVGVDRQSRDKVVLKEARPHAGLSFDREDAVARLRRERDMLVHLDGLDVVPVVRDYLTLGGHHFLVQDFVDGPALNTMFRDRYPLIDRGTDEATVAEYTSWAIEICQRVEDTVSAVHDRGVVIGDVHPLNVLVRPDGQVVLIDLEVASLVSEKRRSPMAAPGFVAPQELEGFEVDRYALACLRLFMFLPLTALFDLDPGKAEQLAHEIAELFPVPRGFLSEAVGVIGGAEALSTGGPIAPNGRPTLGFDPAGWQRARDSMVKAILSSATPDRHDRLYPGDVGQFTIGGGLGLAYGAAGVLFALHSLRADRQPDHEEWLVRRATDPHPGTPLGFYDGLHGVAHVLDRLDRRSDALEVLDICVDRLDGDLKQLGLDLRGGLAGIGLNLAHFAAATGDSSLADAARRVTDVVADRLGTEDSVEEVSGGDHPYAGLLRGSSGPALLFIRLYEQTGDSGLLDLAATALRQDLRRCVTTEDGSLGVNEGWRTMPYLADGSVGIGMVLDDYLLHRQDEEFSQAAPAIRRAAQAQFYVQSGLFYGRAGMILHLGRQHPPGTAGVDPDVVAHVRSLAWHALTYQGHLAFPGDQLLRLSMDLATGTAGVLLALASALNDYPVHLPFLGPPGSDRVPEEADPVSTVKGR
jgi:serine/threonine protein kinase